MQIVNLTKVYNKGKENERVALDNVSFDLPNKGLIFILGKSGSGKSTLLNLLGAIDIPTSGKIIVGSKDITLLKEKEKADYRASYCGFVFQDYNLIPELDVWNNITLNLDDYKEEKINEVLDLVELLEYKNSKINELSGGQAQRIAIARALVKKPKVIFLDEPTAALDNETGREILELLKKLSLERLIVVVSHNEEFASIYSQRTIKLEKGKIIDDTEKTQENSNDILELKRRRLSFKNILNLVWANLKFHKVKFFMTLVISVLTLSLGILFLWINNTLTDDYYYKLLLENDTQYSVIQNTNINLLKDNEYNISYIEDDIYLDDYEQTSLYDTFSLEGYGQIDLARIENFNFSLTGKLPVNDNEVVITKFVQDSLALSLNGELEVEGIKYIITGILDTKFSQQDFLKLKDYNEDCKKEEILNLYKKYFYSLKYGPHTLLYVNNIERYVCEVEFYNKIIFEYKNRNLVETTLKNTNNNDINLFDKDGIYLPIENFKEMLYETKCNVTYDDITFPNYNDLINYFLKKEDISIDEVKKYEDIFEKYSSYLPSVFTINMQIEGKKEKINVIGISSTDDVKISNYFFKIILDYYGKASNQIIRNNQFMQYIKDDSINIENALTFDYNNLCSVFNSLNALIKIFSIVFLTIFIIFYIVANISNIKDKKIMYANLKANGYHTIDYSKIIILINFIVLIVSFLFTCAVEALGYNIIKKMILNNTNPIFKITIFTGNILGYDAILIFICSALIYLFSLIFYSKLKIKDTD